MNDENKSKKQLIKELSELRKKLNEYADVELKYTKILERWAKVENGANHDISVVKGNENIIRILFDNAFEAFRDNAAIMTISNLEDGRFIEVNRGFTETLGYKPEEVIGKTSSEIGLFSKDMRDRAIRELNKNGSLSNYPITAQAKDGKHLAELWSAQVIAIGSKKYLFSVIINDTNRKMAEDELWRTKERFRTLVETSTDWVWELDRNGRFTYASPQVRDILGYDPEEIIGKTPVDFLSPNETKRVGENYYNFITSGGSLPRIENTLVHKDGHEVIAEASGVPFFDSDGNFSGLRGITRDITKRKHAEEALREQLDFLQMLIDTIPNPIYYKDSNSVYQGCNKAFQEYMGRTGNEIIEKFAHDLVPMHLIEKHNRTDQELLREPGVSQFETPFLHADGTVRDVVLNKASITGKDGAVTGVVGVIIDITDRRRAEEERIRLMTAIEQADEGVIITNKDGIIQYINPAYENITDYPREELINQSTGSFMIQEGESFYIDMARHVRTGEVWKGQYSIKRKDGKYRQIQATVSPTKDPSGNIINFVILARDITREAIMEKQLKQAHKMEAIGTLAGGIAHDFNNILSAVIGFTEITLPTVDKSSSSYRNLSEVIKAGERAKELVRQILTFSRQSDYESHPVQVSLIVKEALKLLRASIPTTIEIRQDIQSDSVVMGNHTQIHQVMMNLCTNAAHAMEDKPGVLSVSLAEVELDEEAASRHPDMKHGTYLRLTVKDTGDGMTGDIMERIFDPFFTTKKKGEGTGMGLSVVHGIVKSYGGAIDVSSVLRKGSEFKVYFPIIEMKEESKIGFETTAIPTGTERILLIDDEQAIVDMSQQMLEHLGYSVTSRTSSIEAMELFKVKNNHFDLVVTDMTMPHMTGEELAKEFIQIQPNIPIILCTGFSASLTQEKAESIGIKSLLLKPVSFRQLAETVRQVLDQKI